MEDMFKNLFTDKIIKNVSYIAIDKIVNKFLFILLVIFIGRILGVEGLGAYAFIFALIGLVFPFSSIGMRIFIRDLIINKRFIHKFWGNFLILKFFNSLIVYIILIIITLIYPMPEELKSSIYLTGFILFWDTFFVSARAIFISYQKIKPLALASIIGNLLTVCLSVLFILSGKGIFWIVISFAIGRFVNAAMLNFILIKRFSKPNLKLDVKLCTKWVKKGFFFVMQRQFATGLYRIDILVIFLMSSLYATGLYQAPYKIATNLEIIPTIFMSVFYPYYVKINQFSSKRLKWYYKKYKLYIAILSIVLCLFLFIFSRQITLLLYGKEFLGSVFVLKILAISILFLGLNNNNTELLNALKKEKICFYLLFFIFLLNLILNIILIKSYGLIGIALSTVACSVTYFIITENYIRKELKFKF